MPYNKWDVVFIHKFPNEEDKTKNTPKPAIVLYVSDSTVTVCPITKQVHQAKNYSNTILIELNTPEALQMSLDYESIIVLDRIEELDTSKIAFKFGTCHKSTIELIRAFLGE